MKPKLLTAFSGFAFLFVLLLAGCQKEELLKPNLKDAKVLPRELPACCVASLPSSPEVVYSYAPWGITVTAYNDATTTYVTISRTPGNGNGVMTLRYRQPGQCPNPTTGATVCEACSSYSTSFANPAGWVCGDPVTFSFYASGLGVGGPPNTLNTCIITYNLKNVCEMCEILEGDYFTYSHGFYGNNNGSDFLDDHPELGPVTVGCGTNTTDYSLADIKVLIGGGDNAPPGILVKQILAMTLNVGASTFLASEEDLGCLVIVADENPLTTLDDLFEGMTVNEVIAAANDFVGGCDTTSFTEGQLTDILKAIIDNFHLGTENLGLLTCCEE